MSIFFLVFSIQVPYPIKVSKVPLLCIEVWHSMWVNTLEYSVILTWLRPIWTEIMFNFETRTKKRQACHYFEQLIKPYI